ncbi:hypothetical protein B566_EDAN003808, partial [Ephemera danica]
MWNINVTQIHCASLYLPFDDLCGVRNARQLDADSSKTEPIPNNSNMSWTEDASLFPLASGPVENFGKIIGEYEGSNFDMAVIKMNETVIYNAAIRPVCFPEDQDEPYTRFTATIMGWGSIGGPTTSNPLLLGASNVPIFSNNDCSNAWATQNVFIRD